MNRNAFLKPPPVWSKSSPLLVDDASTVSHVYFRGGALIDTKALTWTPTGAPPISSGSRLIPPGAGPCSDTAYWTCTNVALRFAGDFTITIVYIAPTNTSANAIACGSAYGGPGYAFLNGGTYYASGYVSGGLVQDNVGHPTGVVCVSSFGRAGTVGHLQTNALAPRTNSSVPATAASENVLLGRYTSAGGGWNGQILEVIFSTATPSGAGLTAISAAVKAALKGTTVW